MLFPILVQVQTSQKQLINNPSLLVPGRVSLARVTLHALLGCESLARPQQKAISHRGPWTNGGPEEGVRAGLPPCFPHSTGHTPCPTQHLATLRLRGRQVPEAPKRQGTLIQTGLAHGRGPGKLPSM